MTLSPQVHPSYSCKAMSVWAIHQYNWTGRSIVGGNTG